MHFTPARDKIKLFIYCWEIPNKNKMLDDPSRLILIRIDKKKRMIDDCTTDQHLNSELSRFKNNKIVHFIAFNAQKAKFQTQKKNT